MTTDEQTHFLLMALWRGIPADYKRRYAINIWQQFEDNIRAAAYTSSLAKFMNTICARLQVRIGGDDVETVTRVLADGQDRAILRALRDESTAAVLDVRAENDLRRAEWRARRDADEQAATAWFSEQEE